MLLTKILMNIDYPLKFMNYWKDRNTMRTIKFWHPKNDSILP